MGPDPSRRPMESPTPAVLQSTHIHAMVEVTDEDGSDSNH